MCEMCAATTVFDPSRHQEADSLRIFGAEILEVDDAADDETTEYFLPVSTNFVGNLETAGDRDWVAVSLEAGATYQITQSGYWSDGGTLQDSYLRLYDSDGRLVAQNDDVHQWYDSEIDFTVENGGTYYISAGSYQDSYTGTYTLEFARDWTGEYSAQHAPVEALAHYLVDGYWEDNGHNERSFDVRDSNQITVDLSDLTAEGRQLARWALDAWEMVVDLEFVEVASNGQIHFDDDESGAFASYSIWGNSIVTSEVNVSTDWLERYGTEMNSYSMLAYIHEIGHALGLGHQGNYNGGAVYGRDETFANDSWQMSVMSYFHQQENSAITAGYGLPVTPMRADIMAIQSLYGAPEENSVTAGDTTWGHGSDFGNYLDTVFDGFQVGNEAAMGLYGYIVFTIHDTGGHDRLNLSPLSSDSNVNLNDGTFSDVAGRVGGMAIADGTEIEDLLLGSGNDTALGNELDNAIFGRAGNDSLSGGDGEDWLRGGSGSDTLYGGSGDDIVFGGASNDRLYGGAGRDFFTGGKGNDTLEGGSGDDMLRGGDGADTFCFRAGDGGDWIRDFDLSEGDSLLLDRNLVTQEVDDLQALFDAYGHQNGSGIYFTFVTGDTLRLTNVADLGDAGDPGLAWL